MQQTQHINIDHTLNSGQVFLWQKDDESWYGIDGQNIIRLRQEPFEISSLVPTSNYFREDDDFESIKKQLSSDRTVREAMEAFAGLRLIRQDPFQCMVTFIVSSNSNILRIRKNLYEVCRRFGSTVQFDGKVFSLFPEPEQLAEASVNQLLECGMGYRARHVKEAAEAVSSGMLELERLKRLDYYSAKEEIIKVAGVGNKVADCILLFSLEKTDAFPLDTWMLKVLRKYYSTYFEVSSKTITERQYEMLHQRLVSFFGKHCGYAQQFLFKMERDNHQKKWF